MPYSETMRHSNMYSIYAQYEPVDGISEESRAALCSGPYAKAHGGRMIIDFR
jgi:hypothetical protein